MNSKGFTLIELVIVIVLLGILAATAAPKFINLKANAQTATLQGVQASMQGAAGLVHSKSLVAGNQAAPFSTVNIDSSGGTVDITFGYPFANASEWAKIIDIDDNFLYLTVSTTSGSTLIIYLKDNPAPTSFDDPCILFYEVAADANTAPIFTLRECI
jgi:MSHA pilin protein MshA